ncbi:MAG: glutamate synthase subunit beta [Xanthomonadales bacterium]|nr:glutamate synthase subunit beta [Xanthomonadales bacterium]
MGKTTGFLDYGRKVENYKEVKQRTKDYHEFTLPLNDKELNHQAARCMNCGIPFCHSGCPLGNLIPDFNDAVYKEQWQKASDLLHQTNNFPEFTGRLCPAPCEEACVLNIDNQPVTIENIEKNIAEKAFENQWLKEDINILRTGKKVAIIGSGPAGLAAAEQLNRAGHTVVVFEKDQKPGGLLRYGIPDFKLEKHIIDRRLKLMQQAGIEFRTGCEIGKDITIDELKGLYDAIAVCVGANDRRALPIEGAEFKGVIQAMDFLSHNNRVVTGSEPLSEELSAKGKQVIVIGGGDTGSDCIGTSIRQGAKSVLNFEIMPKPTASRPENQPWPYWPMRLRTSSSHQEGAERQWSIATKAFVGNECGKLVGLKTVKVSWSVENGRMQLHEIPDSEQYWPCERVYLAMGFTGTKASTAEMLDLSLNQRQLLNATENNYQVNNRGVFAAGDCRRGQSLIVWAISEGREMAYHIDKYLMGSSNLPQKGSGDLSKA